LLLGGVIQNTEEFALDTRVGRSGDVFAISPLSVAATSSRGRATGRVAIGVLVEGRSGAVPVSSATTRRARSEVGSVGPVSSRAGTVWVIAPTYSDELAFHHINRRTGRGGCACVAVRGLTQREKPKHYH
jgi:hypothetical protein